MHDHRVCILGGTGFVGQHLAAKLNELGMPVKILTRQREKHRELLVLPRVEVIETDIYDPANLQQHFQDCDVIVNLVGILNEAGHAGEGFRKAHVELSRKVMDAAKHSGVNRLLHMSALNADAAQGPSFYLRTKGEAEDYVHTFSNDIQTSSFRPSVIFGPGDSFFNRFAGLIKWTPFIFPLACAQARFAPVYVGDVVEQFVNAIEDTKTYGQRINLCGPNTYTLQELVAYTAKIINKKRLIVGLPDFAAQTQALFLDYFPGKPFSTDNYDSLQVDSICENCAPMPTSIETVVPHYLLHKNQRSRYDEYRQAAHRD